MKFRSVAIALAMTLVAAGLSSAKDSTGEKRDKIRKMTSQTLADLYKLHPAAQAAVEKSAGYAVFSNLGVNLLLVSTARGGGMAVNSANKQETFMRMISVGAGIGAGVKDFRAIFVFETEKALTGFINSGWDAGGQADAAAKVGDAGGAYSGATSVAPGVWAYQITKNGLALQATLQGTKYSKDDDLNKP
jgi:lipid-binding SYLF domain-containing protein